MNGISVSVFLLGINWYSFQVVLVSGSFFKVVLNYGAGIINWFWFCCRAWLIHGGWQREGTSVSGVLVGRGKDEGTVDVTQVCRTCDLREWQPFRFLEVSWVTASDSPVLLINSVSVSKMTFRSIEALQMSVITQDAPSPPTVCWLVSQYVKLIWLVDLVQQSIMVSKNM